MNIEDKMQGSDLIKDIYGYWPTFHDAELVKLYLERDSTNHMANAVLCINYYEVDILNIGTPNLDIRKVNDNYITIKLEAISKSSISDFNQQNVIDQMEITWGSEQFDVDITSSYGADLTFSCKSISVIDVQKNITE